MKLRIHAIHEFDGPELVVEVFAQRAFRSEFLSFTRLLEGRLEWVKSQEDSNFVSTIVSDWKEFPDDKLNRHTLLSLLGRAYHYQQEWLHTQESITEILKPLLKQMDISFSENIVSRPAKEGIADVKVMDWKNPPKRFRIRTSPEKAKELLNKALASSKRFRDWLANNPFPWMVRK